jgi:two-component system chemotaxis response regulator CheB
VIEPKLTADVIIAKSAKPAVLETTEKIVMVGASTGGTEALKVFLEVLPKDSPGMVIVQHMPPMFTRLLAERLQKQSALDVVEGEEGTPIVPGRVVVAPGDHHLRVRRNGEQIVATLDRGPHENSCRPAVDVLFRSVNETWGGATIAVILTGMGQDGLRGVEQLKASGAYVIAQDEASSVVWGMPGAVVRAGLADAVVPLDQVVPEILKQL